MSLRKRFPDAADFKGRMKARTVKVRLPPVVQQQAFRFSEQRMEMEPIRSVKRECMPKTLGLISNAAPFCPIGLS
ncbi:hypothetical protein LWI28_022006 [Acer negundo]|uniref:Uncharacterized protein n=1 Tax=Acer negundo TaxID=4023 RepID=A0AAD5NLA8_ACENE|nr:hypothetical protein LWI28_022006 [Acer negundo]